MHRFCGDCIQKCLRGGKQECPSCRQHVPSKRSLRRDHMYDALILQVYSDVERFERREDKRMEELNRIQIKHISRDLQQQIQQQVDNRRRLSLTKRNTSTSSSSGRGSSSSSSSGSRNNNSTNRDMQRRQSSSSSTSSRDRKRGGKKSKEKTSSDSNARFRLMRDPNEKDLDELEHPWLCTSPQIQVRHLKKYLSRKINVEAQRIEITFFIGGDTQIMCDDKARFVEIEALQQPKHKDEHCVLFFRIAR
jgi:E3 ubiquitin-protein ligase RNF1/2